MTIKLFKKQEVVTSGKNTSLWIDTEEQLLFDKLDKDISVDVVVVGGGITGVTTAYNLTNEGKKVALVEDGAIGSGETGRTTAHFTYALDDRYYSIRKLLGDEMTKLSAQSHKEAIDFVEKIIKKEKIKCDFKRVDGYLFLHYTDSTESFKKELNELHSIGFKEIKLARSSPQKSLNSGPCLLFPNQAKVHPLKYINALCRIIKKKGGLIFTKSHVRKTKKGKVITDDGYEIHAKDIVIATGSNIKGGKIFTKQVPYRTYVSAFRIPKGSVKDALYWDTGNQDKGQPYPYHYIRIYNLDSKTDLLIVGGEDHKTGQQDEPEKKIFSNIEKWTKERFPIIGKAEYRWSGQVVEPLDYMAFIGESPYHKGQRIWIATGDSGNGMTHGTIAGILLTDIIMGRKNKWSELYDPQRKTGYMTKEFITEGINFAKQYLDYLMPGEVKSSKEIPKDQGAIIRQGVTKLAVYRDKKGKIHSHSAVCTHMQCLVKWNNVEKTFDCPCHGSRFSPIGKVLNGPATKPLEKKDLKEE